MIPKKIHYCWFGRNPKPDIILQCIESWKKYCPDYEIIEWNEDNFDVNCIPYTAAAYADKKWAFVSDYARLAIVYEHGGVYLDTDVMLHNSLDELLEYDCWLASDDVRFIATGLGFGAEKRHPLIGVIHDAYKNYEYPSRTNVIRDTKIIEQILPEWKKSNKNQVVGENLLIIGLDEYGRYAKHLYTYTWADEITQSKRMNEIENKIKNNHKNSLRVKTLWKIKCWMRQPKFIAFFDKHKGTKIERIYTFCAYDLLDYGILHFVKRLGLKLSQYLSGE